MIYLNIALACLLALFVYLYLSTRLNNKLLIEDYEAELVECGRSYKALEQGRDEETESYQQIIISADETITAQKHALEFADADAQEMELEILAHRRGCLPDYAGMRQMEFEGVPMTHSVEALLEPCPVWESMKDWMPATG